MYCSQESFGSNGGREAGAWSENENNGKWIRTG